MYRLISTIWKDVLILTRDRVGLGFMFLMPVVLAIVITATQNSTFELVNNNKVHLVICNRDTGAQSIELVKGINESGMFTVTMADRNTDESGLQKEMDRADALIAIEIPAGFSTTLRAKADATASSALKDFGFDQDHHSNSDTSLVPLRMLYNPVLQPAFRYSVRGGIMSILQMVQTKTVVEQLYLAMNDTALPDSVEQQMVGNKTAIEEYPIAINGKVNIPNATQHNIPAWTIFAMFFIVISMGSSLVREKTSGSFLRLRTLPTSFSIALLSKQITYLVVTLLQATLIFLIGIYFFTYIGLPPLKMPSNIPGLILVTLSCGIAAVSFALLIGVFTQTQEQANGIGAVSVVLLAAVGGVFVPDFAMPTSFKNWINVSPLHWGLEGYYQLFLGNGGLNQIVTNLLPLWAIIIILQLIAFTGLKKQNLV